MPPTDRPGVNLAAAQLIIWGPWPRLFHNLRSSLQTELAERFPSHVVCDWLGNSEDIARKHYYQTTDQHFAMATADVDKAKQNPKQYDAATTVGDSHRQTDDASFSKESSDSRKTTRAKADGEGREHMRKTRGIQAV